MGIEGRSERRRTKLVVAWESKIKFKFKFSSLLRVGMMAKAVAEVQHDLDDTNPKLNLNNLNVI